MEIQLGQDCSIRITEAKGNEPCFPDSVTVQGIKFISTQKLRQALDELLQKKYAVHVPQEHTVWDCINSGDVERIMGGLCK